MAHLDGRGLSALEQLVVEEFYETVPDAWLITGMAHRCAHCGGLLRPHPDKRGFPDGFCPIRHCAAKRRPTVGKALSPERAHLLVALPQILAYWTGPGLDEVALHDAAVRGGLPAEIYPESDLCDVSIGGRAVGIDAKSYSSPVSLALRLNRGIGGLINYRRRIVAVGDEMLGRNPDYIRILRENLDDKGDASTVEIMGVSNVVEAMKGMRHAV